MHCRRCWCPCMWFACGKVCVHTQTVASHNRRRPDATNPGCLCQCRSPDHSIAGSNTSPQQHYSSLHSRVLLSRARRLCRRRLQGSNRASGRVRPAGPSGPPAPGSAPPMRHPRVTPPPTLTTRLLLRCTAALLLPAANAVRRAAARRGAARLLGCWREAAALLVRLAHTGAARASDMLAGCCTTVGRWGGVWEGGLVSEQQCKRAGGQCAFP